MATAGQGRIESRLPAILAAGMGRREFIALLVLTAIGSHRTALAKRSRHIPLIAVLRPYGESTDNIFSPIFRKDFDQALRNLGWIDRRNIVVEYHDAAGEFEQLHKLAKESVELHPDVIVAVNTPLVAAVLVETHTIPVVFGLVSDPVGSGFVQSFARPGGNATGFAYGGRDLVSKWVELLKEISPAIDRVAVLFNPDAAPGGGAFYMRPFEAAAALLGITPVSAPVRNPGEIERVISGLEGQPPSGLVVTPDYFVGSQRALIIALAARHKVPAMYFLPQFAVTGGLMSYSIDDPLEPRLAAYVDRILKGAKPEQLPVQEPIKFKLTLNLKTANALGLAVPPTLLTRADEVIE
jgi:putative ABC transport system substrate-binding protein